MEKFSNYLDRMMQKRSTRDAAVILLVVYSTILIPASIIYVHSAAVFYATWTILDNTIRRFR